MVACLAGDVVGFKDEDFDSFSMSRWHSAAAELGQVCEPAAVFVVHESGVRSVSMSESSCEHLQQAQERHMGRPFYIFVIWHHGGETKKNITNNDTKAQNKHK